MSQLSPEPALIVDGLAVYRFGEGEPVCFMPGPHRFQRPGIRSADALIDGLVAVGRSVITFDPPGSGHSMRPAHLGIDEMHACTAEALAACGISGPVDMLGHSMGGLVTLSCGIEQPECVKRMILVGTGAGGPAFITMPGALASPRHPAFWGVALRGFRHMLVPCRASEELMQNYIHRVSFVDPQWVEDEPVRPR
ncbi:MAG: alpha/beta fold hydrolase, partial [Anaerolineae bacterium]|nr:alpha/beta fold hydrolase [Anaerolineae bacterium]